MLKFFLSALVGGFMLFTSSWWLASFYTVGLMFGVLSLVPLVEGISVIGVNFYSDTLSFSLCYLTLWLTILMMVASNQILKKSTGPGLFIGLVYSLMSILLVSFLTSNYLMFYFFFEASLIPTLLVITGWGFQPERLQAGIYFMLYTLTASLPLLLGLFYFYYLAGSLLMWSGVDLLGVDFGIGQLVLAFSLTMAFFVKMPMFLVHLWLPSAHVEAPVAGSMILAGVLLKLGGYGVSRVLPSVFSGVAALSFYLIGLSLFGMIYVGFMCCRLNDMKALVAYSSVAHMGLVLAGILSGYFWGLTGGLMMMISHGVSSSGLFCIVNVYYERSGSRSLFVNKGLLGIFPILALMMFLLCASNVSAPPTINLLSEIFLMLSVLSYDSLMLLAFPLGSFLGAVFTFYLFSFSQHGKSSNTNINLLGPGFSDLHALTLHVVPLNFLVLSAEVFFLWL